MEPLRNRLPERLTGFHPNRHNCPGLSNDPQVDTDADLLGDPCDPTPLPEPGGALGILAGVIVLARLKRRRGRIRD